MNEALVEYAKNNINGDQRSEYQQQFVPHRALEQSRCAGKGAVDAGRQVNLAGRLLDRGGRVAE